MLGWRHYKNRLSTETYRLFNNDRSDSIAGSSSEVIFFGVIFQEKP